MLAETLRTIAGRAVGLDIDRGALRLAGRHVPAAAHVHGDGLDLPFAAGAFDACLTHFLLLWVARPARALQEMARVTRPGGWVFCFAEPDYGGRLDAPDDLAESGQLQSEALRRQGADPLLGRRLRALLRQAGLEQVHAAVLGAEWAASVDAAEAESEIETLRLDLDGLIGPRALEELIGRERRAAESGQRLVFVPTFCAWGRVPPSGR